jgi:hypothetical protein
MSRNATCDFCGKEFIQERDYIINDYCDDCWSRYCGKYECDHYICIPETGCHYCFIHDIYFDHLPVAPDYCKEFEKLKKEFEK